MNELYQRLLNLCKSSKDVDQLKSELDLMEGYGVLEDLYVMYQKVKNNPALQGDENLPGSLVAYHLGITKKRPQSTFSLEKRRTYGRAGFPDIDMDFDYAHRHKIVEYLIEKYGRDHVGNIGTVQKLKTKAALRRTIKVLDPDDSVIFNKKGEKVKDEQSENFRLQNEILGSLPGLMKRADGTFVLGVKEAYEEYGGFRKYMDAYPEVYRIAQAAEGGIAAYGCHPAGIVISPIPLAMISPMHLTRGAEEKTKVMATQFSMSDVESLGLIKFDVLALSTKTAIAWAVEEIKERHDVEINLASLPLDDRPTLKLLESTKTDGCFQLENTGMKQTLQKIGIDSFDDLVVAVAMYRPGPKDYIPELSKRKRGITPVSFPHPIMKSITQRTYGIMAYQEQVMHVFMSMADLTATEGYKFMKGCAKKKRELIEASKEKFFKGSLSNGVDRKVIEKIWADMEKFGGYAFNKTLYFSEGIVTSKGEYTIEELFLTSKDDLPQVYSSEGVLIDIVGVYDHGLVPMYKVTFSDGTVHRCTGHHKFSSDLGTLPLYEIIERDAQIIVNRRVLNASQKRPCLPRLRLYYQDSEISRCSQKRVSGVEAEEIDDICLVKSQKLKTVLGQCDGRRDAALSIQDVDGGIGVHSPESKREGSSPAVDDSVECGLLCGISTESHSNCKEDIIEARHSEVKNEAAREMERGAPRRVLRKMHQTCNGAEGLEIRARDSLERYSDSNGIQIFPGSQEQQVFYQITPSSSGFSGSQKEDVGRVRRSTSFSRWVWETPENVCSERQAAERSHEEQRISCDTDILRCVGASKKTIQIHRNGNVDGCNYQQYDSAPRDFYWSHVRVVDVEFIGLCQGYDLEVDSDDHLYCLASGVVNSNSHACSYAYESFKTAYLKAHYPMEFMAARLSVEAYRRNFDDVEKYEMDCITNLGITIEPPDLNRSSLKYKIIGERRLLRPLLIKGIGDKAAEEIVSHQPYEGSDILYSFGMKVGKTVNSRVMESMYDAGLFQKCQWSKAELLRKFEQIKKDRKASKGRPVGDIFG